MVSDQFSVEQPAVPFVPLPPGRGEGPIRRRIIRIGHFFFGYRNYLFPLAFLVLFLVTKPEFLAAHERADWWMDMGGLAIILIGQGCRVLAVGSVENIRRGGRQKQIAAQVLIRSGIFAHTRNPLYLGNLLIVCGLVLIANCRWWDFLVLPGFAGVYYAMVIAEEDFLARKFGPEYIAYCQAVNRFLPTFKGLRLSLSRCPLDWKRVVRKESGIVCSWGVALIGVLIWKQWQRFGYAERETPIKALIVLLLLLVLAYEGVLWLRMYGKLRS